MADVGTFPYVVLIGTIRKEYVVAIGKSRTTSQLNAETGCRPSDRPSDCSFMVNSSGRRPP